jgi:outer membrane lipoprotein-sorting protein
MIKRHWVRWILIFGVWTLLGALSAVRVTVSLAYSGGAAPWRRAFVIALADWYAWALLAPAIAWLARRFAIERRSWLRSLLAHLPASLFFSILKMMIESRLLQWFDPAQRHLLQLPSTFFTYYAILGAIYAFDYYGKYREHELKSSHLQAQLAQAQLQALGGRMALERLTTRIKTGTLVAQGGMKAPLEVYEKAPNKTLTIFRAPHGTNQMGFDGAIGWTKTPEQGLREEAGQQLDFIRSEAEFYKELKLKERYSKLTLLGLARLDNREAYVIETAPPHRQPEKLYFDLQTGLLVRMDIVPELGNEKMRVQAYFEDYRVVDGVKLPFAIRHSRPGFTWTYQFDEIKLNAQLDDSKFNKPAAP